jgi:5'(3')-deoxyribonucleotidase
MSFRIAVDMDGVLADLTAAYREIEARLFGAAEPESVGQQDECPPLITTDSSVRTNVKRRHRVRDAIWDVIRTTPDFWVGLKPIERNAVRRLHALMLENRWEVFFITQRPATQGDTVQRQTQRWLHEQGFDMPSVLVLSGSRAGIAASLSLDYYVDDDAANCVDVTSASHARSILIADDDAATVTSARRLGIATARNFGIALDLLHSASTARPQPGVLQQLAQLVGWK